MGDGEAGRAQGAPAGRALEAVQADWRELRRAFSGFRSRTNLRDVFIFARRRFLGDVTLNQKLSYWRKAKDVMARLTDPEVDYLRTLAQQRLDLTGSLFRGWAVLSLTLPISALVIANQLAPDWLRREVFDDADRFSNGVLTGYAVLVVMNLIQIYLNLFKAREMATALELEAAERRLRRGELSPSAAPAAAAELPNLPGGD